LDHSLEPARRDLRHAELAPAGHSLFEVLSGLFWKPQRILFFWNWKSAWLSILLRAPIFLVAAAGRGVPAAFSAVLTECFFCALSAGFYGALVQNLRDAEPEWLTVLFLALVVPAVFQVFEFLLHWFRGTPHLKAAVIVSMIVSGISSLFNWFAMRRGALLMGSEGRSFGSDLRRMPGLIVAFIAIVPRWIARRKREAAGG
jgi:hypothetical protein